MTEAALIELFTKGGLSAVLVVVIFFGGRWFGREMIAAVKELTAEVKQQGTSAAARHIEVVAQLGGLSERVARTEVRADERDDFDEATPVRNLRPMRNGKRP